MTPADHHGRAAAVRYYECTSTHKGKSHGCPVVRVNAHALHEAVLGEIRRAAEHPTRTEEMIREAVKALPERDRDWETDLKAVARRLRDAERQVARLTDVIASSNSKTPMAPLLRRLDELEGQRRDLEQEHERLTREAEAAKVRRPDAGRCDGSGDERWSCGRRRPRRSGLNSWGCWWSGWRCKTKSTESADWCSRQKPRAQMWD
jgi:hypothetical protein